MPINVLHSLKRIIEAPQHLTIHSFMGKSNELYVFVCCWGVILVNVCTLFFVDFSFWRKRRSYKFIEKVSRKKVGTLHDNEKYEAANGKYTLQ